MTSENKLNLLGILKTFAQHAGGSKATAALDMLASDEGREVARKVVKDAVSTLSEALDKIVTDAQITTLEARLKALTERNNRPKNP